MTPAKKISILIVEDQEFVRLGLRLALENMPQISIVGECTDGLSAVKMSLQLKPDVVLMDIGLPLLSGIEAAKLIMNEQLARIIMFTAHDDDQSIFAAMSAGAAGYCLKDVSATRLWAAISAVDEGAVWLDDRVAVRLLQSCSSHAALSANENKEATAQLSTLEFNVLTLIVEGFTHESIAAQLSIDIRNLELCLSAIVETLARSDRAQAARQAVLKGLYGANDKPISRCSQCQRDLHQGFAVCPFDGAKLIRSPEEFLVGQTFADRYEILSLLGHGGMSIVYLARHKFMNRKVAIKVLHPEMTTDLNNVKRFRQEAEAVSTLQHPHLINVFDFGLSLEGEAFLVMDYVEGVTLNDILRKEGTLSLERFVNVFSQTCDALQHAHERGVIHRDLKPSNIMLVKEPNGSESVRVIDFGIAKLDYKHRTAANLTQPGEVFGSPTYMSPEQCMGVPTDARSDVYSLGCVMHEALTGGPPFLSEDPYQTMNSHVNQPPEPLNKVDPTLQIPACFEELIMRTLEKISSSRPQSMAEVQGELAKCARAIAASAYRAEKVGSSL